MVLSDVQKILPSMLEKQIPINTGKSIPLKLK